MQDPFYMEWKAVSNLMRRKFNSCSLCTEAADLSGMQIFVLDYLYRNRDHAVFQRDLEAEFLVRRSTITGIVQGMEQKKLLKRISVKNDARLKQILLTDRAIALHEAVTQTVEKMEHIALEGLTDEEIAVFLAVLNKMKDNLGQCHTA